MFLEHIVCSRMALTLTDANCVCDENNFNAPVDVFLFSLGEKRLWGPYKS